jgi:hypothetical protein
MALRLIPTSRDDWTIPRWGWLSEPAIRLKIAVEVERVAPPEAGKPQRAWATT